MSIEGKSNAIEGNLLEFFDLAGKFFKIKLFVFGFLGGMMTLKSLVDPFKIPSLGNVTKIDMIGKRAHCISAEGTAEHGSILLKFHQRKRRH